MIISSNSAYNHLMTNGYNKNYKGISSSINEKVFNRKYTPHLFKPAEKSILYQESPRSSCELIKQKLPLQTKSCLR